MSEITVIIVLSLGITIPVLIGMLLAFYGVVDVLPVFGLGACVWAVSLYVGIADPEMTGYAELAVGTYGFSVLFFLCAVLFLGYIGLMLDNLLGMAFMVIGGGICVWVYFFHVAPDLLVGWVHDLPPPDLDEGWNDVLGMLMFSTVAVSIPSIPVAKYGQTHGKLGIASAWTVLGELVYESWIHYTQDAVYSLWEYAFIGQIIAFSLIAFFIGEIVYLTIGRSYAGTTLAIIVGVGAAAVFLYMIIPGILGWALPEVPNPVGF